MPLSKYFKGHGEKVMKNMKQEYGGKKGKSVFYATANSIKKKSKGVETGPSKLFQKKKGM